MTCSRVHAVSGLLNPGGLDGEGKAVHVATGVFNAVIDPDRSRGFLEVLVVVAGNEVVAAAGEEVRVITHMLTYCGATLSRRV